YLFLDSLRRLHHHLGDDFKACDLTPLEMAQGFASSMLDIFVPDESGARPYLGDDPRLQKDPHFRDHLLFYEHFHGETGRGLGASHQTGWTGLIANLINDLYS
ncbi:MAG: glucosidase, partial [Simkaniaceae bacterium]|nr:glucosidase [Simkaniaceae bacterium]